MDQIRPIPIHNRITTVVILSRYKLFYHVTAASHGGRPGTQSTRQNMLNFGRELQTKCRSPGGNAHQRCKCKQKDNKKSHRKMFQNAHWVTDNPKRQYAKRLTINQC